MDKHKIFLFSVFLFSVLLISSVSAATVLVTPAANTNHTGTISLVNCTTAVANAMNATIWYNSTTVSNTTLTTIVNDTDGDTEFTEADVDVSTLDDIADYQFWCEIKGDTTENSTENTDITIDNTAPSVSVSLQRKMVSWGIAQKVTWTITDTLDSSPTETCTLTKVNGDTVSATSSPHTFTFGDLNQVGTFTFSCTGEDYTGNVGSASNTFIVETDEIIDDVIADGPSVFPIVIGIVAFLVVLVLVIILASKKKK